jgi:leader peptidase (prepilin peptidase)/N-methyltransferase
MIIYLWLLVFFAWLFVLGSAVGSFLNVVIYRLPPGKNLFWPPSRCGTCFAPIAFRDNVPLLSYWKLHGRCRVCGAAFSVRYFLVEFACGAVFALLYFLEVGLNIHGLEQWPYGGLHYLQGGGFPPQAWPFFAAHALFASLLIAALGCVLDTGRLPPALAVTGAVTGVVWSLLSPWPHEGPFAGLAGLLLGSGMLRLVNAIHRTTRGEEVFGPDGPALFLMVGAFLGWERAVGALVVAALLMHPLSRFARSPQVSFVLAGVVGVVLAWLGWRWIAPVAEPWLRDPLRLLMVLVGLTAALVWLGDALGKRFALHDLPAAHE